MDYRADASAFLAVALLQLNMGSMDSNHHYTQADRHTCGTIALLHAGCYLGILGLLDRHSMLGLHAWLQSLPQDCQFGSILIGFGPNDIQSQLAALLASKGVPIASAPSRATAAIQKLGLSSTQHALPPAGQCLASTQGPGHQAWGTLSSCPQV